MGEEAAEQLTAYYGGDVLYIPCCHHLLCRKRNKLLCVDFDNITREKSATLTVSMLSQRYGLSDRHILRILKKPSTNMLNG